jgi:NitT/TauT family transport system substrate-binding protein
MPTSGAAGRSRRLGVFILAACAVAAMLVAGCGSGDDDSSGNDGSSSGNGGGQSVRLVIGYPPGLYTPAFYVAQERTWPALGLDVELSPVDGSSVVAQQLVAKRADYGMATAASVYLADVEGADLRGVSLFTHDDAALLSVPEDSEIQSVEQLKGEAIGVTSASDGALPLVKAVLSDAGISEGDYSLPVVGAGGPAAAQALKSGRVAAYAHGVSDVGPIEAVARVPLREIMPEKFVGLPGNVLAVRAETLEDPADRQIVEKLAQGWHEAAAFLAENPDEALELICRAAPEQCEDKATARAVAERGTIANQPVEGDEPGEIDLVKTKTLIDTLGSDTPISVEEVFPANALGSASGG